MTLEEAVEILDHHNRWRRGASIATVDPRLLGIAIDVVIKEFKKGRTNETLRSAPEQQNKSD